MAPEELAHLEPAGVSDDGARPRAADCRSRDPQAYVAQVMAEIEEEVRLRRASGDLPPKLERELDELFLAHSPVAGRGGDLTEALRMVDAATFVDPVVPVDSERAAGAVVKKGMRTLLLWYVGWITHQVSQFASAVSRTLHIVEGRLKELERKVEVQRVPSAGVVEFPALHGADAWWVEPAVEAVDAGARAASCTPPAATGGWCSQIIAAGGDAYGVDPRTNLVDQGVLDGVRSAGRGSGRSPARRGAGRAGRRGAERRGRRHGQRRARRSSCIWSRTTLAPGGVLVVHSLSRVDVGRRRTRRTRPTWPRADRCGPRPGATCSSRAATAPRWRAGPTTPTTW